MSEGVDFSSSRPGGTALAAAGKAFCVRYIPYGGYAKGLTAVEVADYHAHGLSIALVFESITQRPLGGVRTGPDNEYAAHLGVPVPAITSDWAGQADAWKSAEEAAALGFPAGTPIYFAVDWDATLAQQPAIDAYLRGAASVIGASRVGVYGGIRVVTRCRNNGSAAWFWQTYAWSAGQVAAFAHLYQYHNGQSINGASVDLCRSLQDNFGQWAVNESPPTGGEPVMARILNPQAADGTFTTGPNGATVYRVHDGADGPVGPNEPQPVVMQGTLEGFVDDAWFTNNAPDGELRAYPKAQGTFVTTVPPAGGTVDEQAIRKDQYAKDQQAVLRANGLGG